MNINLNQTVSSVIILQCVCITKAPTNPCDELSIVICFDFQNKGNTKLKSTINYMTFQMLTPS